MSYRHPRLRVDKAYGDDTNEHAYQANEGTQSTDSIIAKIRRRAGVLCRARRSWAIIQRRDQRWRLAKASSKATEDGSNAHLLGIGHTEQMTVPQRGRGSIPGQGTVNLFKGVTVFSDSSRKERLANHAPPLLSDMVYSTKRAPPPRMMSASAGPRRRHSCASLAVHAHVRPQFTTSEEKLNDPILIVPCSPRSPHAPGCRRVDYARWRARCHGDRPCRPHHASRRDVLQL